MAWYIAAGGIIGTLARYYLQGWAQAKAGGATFPVGTLAINITGSLAIGFIIRLATGSTLIGPEMRAALTIGFCGAYTTMSTFSYETVRLLTDGEYARATMYLGGSMVGCLVAVIIGTAIAQKLL